MSPAPFENRRSEPNRKRHSRNSHEPVQRRGSRPRASQQMQLGQRQVKRLQRAITSEVLLSSVNTGAFWHTDCIYSTRGIWLFEDKHELFGLCKEANIYLETVFFRRQDHTGWLDCCFIWSGNTHSSSQSEMVFKQHAWATGEKNNSLWFQVIEVK